MLVADVSAPTIIGPAFKWLRMACTSGWMLIEFGYQLRAFLYAFGSSLLSLSRSSWAFSEISTKKHFIDYEYIGPILQRCRIS